MPAPTFTHGDAAVARRYDTWFDTSWGAHAWSAETRAALAALGPIAGRTVATVLNPTSLWGLLDRPARHDPHSRGTYPNRAEMLRLGRRHGRARRLAPRFGAVQILTVEVGSR